MMLCLYTGAVKNELRVSLHCAGIGMVRSEYKYILVKYNHAPSLMDSVHFDALAVAWCRRILLPMHIMSSAEIVAICLNIKM